MLFRHRRFPYQSLLELASIVGIRVTPRVLNRMGEYAELCDVHEALNGAPDDADARGNLRRRVMADLPDAYHTYILADMEPPPDE